MLTRWHPKSLRLLLSLSRAAPAEAARGVSPSAPVLVVREDVGRHNAVDKVIGWALLAGRLPQSASVAATLQKALDLEHARTPSLPGV